MKRLAGFCTPRSRGFSLIEVILVIVVLAIGMVALVPMFGQVSRGWSQTGDVQTGAQLVQQCGEHILGTRRQAGGYGLINATICNGLTSTGGFSAPTVTTNTAYAGSGCPAGAQCNLVVITVNKGVSVLASTTLLLVN